MIPKGIYGRTNKRRNQEKKSWKKLEANPVRWSCNLNCKACNLGGRLNLMLCECNKRKIIYEYRGISTEMRFRQKNNNYFYGEIESKEFYWEKERRDRERPNKISSKVMFAVYLQVFFVYLWQNMGFTWLRQAIKNGGEVGKMIIAQSFSHPSQTFFPIWWQRMLRHLRGKLPCCHF